MKHPITLIIVTLFALAIIGGGVYLALTKTDSTRSSSNTQVVTNNNSPTVEEMEEPIWLAYEDGGADPEVYKAFESDLLKLFFDYRDAWMLTQASLHLNYEQTSKESFDSLSNQVIAKWDDVEADVAKVTSYSQNPKTSWVWDWYRIKSESHRPLIPAANAQSDVNFGDEMTSEESIRYHGMDEFHALQNIMPDADEESLIQQSFGGTAIEVKRHYIDYRASVAENWGDWVAIHDFGSKAATAIDTSSKVALFVGGAVITGGASGLAASVSLGGGTLMLASGADLICDIGQGASALGFADPETGETFSAIQKKLGPLTFVANVTDVKNYAENPGGAISAVRGLATTAANVLSFDVENGGMYVAPKKLEDVRIPTINSDGIVENYFPPGYAYDVNPGQIKNIEKEAEENRVEAEEAAAASVRYVGTYEGTIKASIPAYGNISASVPVKILVGQKKVKMTFSDGGNLPYKISGMPYSLSLDYFYSGELTGEVNENKTGFDITGKFSSSGKVNMPAEVAQNMPPEMGSQLSSKDGGNATAHGDFSADNKSITGSLKLNGASTSINASFTAQQLGVFSE